MGKQRLLLRFEDPNSGEQDSQHNRARDKRVRGGWGGRDRDTERDRLRETGTQTK